MSLWRSAVVRMHGWRWSMQGRLNRRLLMWFLLFSIVPLIGTNAVGYRRSQGIIRRTVERSLSSLADVQAQLVRDRVDRHLLSLQAIVAGNEFLVAGVRRAQGRPSGEMGQVATRTAMDELLARKLAELPAFTALYLFTPSGEVLASAGPASAVTPAAPADPRAPSVTVGLSQLTRGAEPQFRLVVPLVSAHGAVAALLGGSVEPAGFRDFLQLPVHAAGHVDGYVVDDQGRPLVAPATSGPVDYTKPLANPLLTQAAAAAGHYRDASDVDMLGAVAPVPNHPWRVVLEQPAAEALGELRALGGLSLLLELVFGLALVAIAWIVAADIVAPVGRLVHATRQVAAGDLRVRVAATQSDEIGELGRAFNEMTSALADTTGRVAELHRREIERASQLATVGELASGIAHEIKNPVVGVSNGLDLVRRRVGADATLRPITDEMARQLTRIQQALQELLTFARPATPAFAPVEVSELIERAIRLVLPAGDRTGATIQVHVDPRLPPIPGDEEMLHHALVNVLMNALQACAPGGRIVVSASAVDGEARIAVADNGRGIAPEHVDAVFKPFFTTRHTGTGLGLSITREIAQRHNGAVVLTSELGVGTVVTIHLPLGACTAPRVAEAMAV